MKADLYNQKGEKTGVLELPKEIFNIEFNADLIHQALVRQLANARSPIAHTMTKGEVRGGGKKPFRQKGTGNARQGSIKNPHMKGGGVVFGPRNVRNFELEMPKKQRRKALFSALSAKIKANDVIGLESYEAKKIRTKPFAEMLKKLPIERDVLIVISEKNETIQKSGRNLPNAKIILVNYLNIHDLQKHKTLLLFKDCVEKMKELFLKKQS